MPALEEALKSRGRETETLAARFSKTKRFVPTRSHPAAGENPPFETVMGLMTAPLDRLADMFRKFPDKRDLPASARDPLDDTDLPDDRDVPDEVDLPNVRDFPDERDLPDDGRDVPRDPRGRDFPDEKEFPAGTNPARRDPDKRKL